MLRFRRLEWLALPLVILSPSPVARLAGPLNWRTPMTLEEICGLTKYVGELYPYRDGGRFETIAETWAIACGVFLDCKDVCHVESISTQSSIYACYRRGAQMQTWEKVGCIKHVSSELVQPPKSQS